MQLSSTLNKSMHKYETAIVTIPLKQTINNTFSTDERKTIEKVATANALQLN